MRHFNYKNISSLLFVLACILTSCSDFRTDCKKTGTLPEIYPDYIGATIPYNIAPLNFCLKEKNTDAKAIFSCRDESFEVDANDGSFTIPNRKWKSLLQLSKGKNLVVTVYVKKDNKWMAYNPFTFQVAKEPIDGYLAYRLIEPGYTLWNKMGIYQRNLENYTQSTVYENKMTDGNCVNCHSFCMQNPDKMLFHMRATYPCTILQDGDKIVKLNTKTEQTISPLVYPSWHPSAKYVAFSVNKTTQDFHPSQRVEVYDTKSDVVVYDVAKQEIVTCPALFSENAFETFPTFSPDGKTLYFCSALAKPMPDNIGALKYSLCSISFDPEKRTFGQKVDTLYSSSVKGKSVAFPRISPDGHFLLFTLSDFGTFPIWHDEADLAMVDLKTGATLNMETVNSNKADSYHSWSSNSRWIVFSSRRMDGLYTRPFFAYVDKNGVVAKPFVLPQKKTGFYTSLMKSYNIPEFITGKIHLNAYKTATMAKKDKGTDLTFVK